jgi:hypothetical protein
VDDIFVNLDRLPTTTPAENSWRLNRRSRIGHALLAAIVPCPLYRVRQHAAGDQHGRCPLLSVGGDIATCAAKTFSSQRCDASRQGLRPVPGCRLDVWSSAKSPVSDGVYSTAATMLWPASVSVSAKDKFRMTFPARKRHHCRRLDSRWSRVSTGSTCGPRLPNTSAPTVQKVVAKSSRSLLIAINLVPILRLYLYSL